MPQQNDFDPAFPNMATNATEWAEHGMDQRTFAASLALAGILSADAETDLDAAADRAVAASVALMKALRRSYDQDSRH